MKPKDIEKEVLKEVYDNFYNRWKFQPSEAVSGISFDDVEIMIKETIQKCRANQDIEVFNKVEEKIEHIIKWYKTKNRKPANNEWTASAERQVGYTIENLEFKNNQIKQETAQAIFDDYCKDCSFKSKKYCRKEKCAWIRYMKKWDVTYKGVL